MTKEASASVFISYRHENDGHRARVRDLAERIEEAGTSVVLDQFAQEREFHGAGPKEGWPRWCKRQATNAAHKVLIISSQGWFRCYEMEEEPGIGLGSTAEAAILEQRIYNEGGSNSDIRLVSFVAINPFDVPMDLQRYHRFVYPHDFDDLIRWLSASPATSTPLSDWPKQLPAINWTVANHNAVRIAFENLLTNELLGRYLSICGPSGTGKSHLTREILGNALRTPGLVCGRLDFKGGIGRSAETQSFARQLELTAPIHRTTKVIDQLGQILHSISKRPQPTLLIFDTYEAASGAKSWVEEQLLPSLIRISWLRVVIAGQQVPKLAGSAWAPEACPPIELTHPPAEAWFDFSKLHKPGITLEFVQQAHSYCRGESRILAQLLGPA